MRVQLTNITISKKNVDFFLGSWCYDLNNPEKKAISKYHWSNFNKFKNDVANIKNIYKLVLIELTNELNQIHNEKHNQNYWEKIIGPWLLTFVGVVFDRLENLKNIQNSKSFSTELPKYAIKEWIPLDFVDFENMASRDDWNLYIYSELIKITKIIKYDETSFVLKNENLYKRKKENYFKKFIKILSNKIIKIIPEKFRNICLIEPGLSILNIIKINLKLKKFPFQFYARKINLKLKEFPFQYYSREKNTNLELDFHNRIIKNDKMKKSSNNTDFFRLIKILSLKNIPISYLEEFKQNKSYALELFPRNPLFILTSYAHFSNEYYKIWTAEQAYKNNKTFISVHGGHHGTALFNLSGELSEDIANTYFSWGWSKNILPSSKLSELKKHSQNKTLNIKNKICFVTYNPSKYPTHLSSSPISSNFKYFLNDHKILFDNINQSIKNNIVLRIRNNSNGWNIKKFYKKIGLKKFTTPTQQTIKSLLNGTSLFIISYDSTLLYETLTFNIPTIIFFNQKYWKLNTVAKKQFEYLKEAGIYYDNPVLLFKFINDLDDSILEKWWKNKITQKTKEEFLNKFGYSDINYLDKWIEIIKDNTSKN